MRKRVTLPPPRINQQDYSNWFELLHKRVGEGPLLLQGYPYTNMPDPALWGSTGADDPFSSAIFVTGSPYGDTYAYSDGTNWVFMATGSVVDTEVGKKLDRIEPGAAAADYGWRDLTAEVTTRGTGASNPSWQNFRDGIYAYEFPDTGSIKEFWIFFHLDHDYAVGSEIFFHMHFAPGNTALAGNVRWGFEFTIAKGHQQGAASVFPSTTTVFATVAVDANSNYEHHVAEISTGVASANLEPDSLVLCRVYRDNTVAGNLAADVYGFTSDIHYQIDRYATKNKSPDFYT